MNFPGALRRNAARAIRFAGRITGVRPAADPVRTLARYSKKAKACGLDSLTLFLSFDCDTDWDIDVVEALDDFLRERGIAVTYVVPGAQLLRGRQPYAAVAAKGREFMNHGAKAHAEWRDDEDQYVPITFYDRMSAGDVISDIEQGHQIVCDVTGSVPKGFRAPHFGSFQRDDDLALIYRSIAKLKYSYASTTVPTQGLAHGPAYRTHGIVELPTFGSARYPELILDTWTHLTDRRRYALGETYYELFADTLETMKRMPALLTWYGDPSHAWQQAPFMKAMDLIAESAIPSLSGSEAAALYSRHSISPRT